MLNSKHVAFGVVAFTREYSMFITLIFSHSCAFLYERCKWAGCYVRSHISTRRGHILKKYYLMWYKLIWCSFRLTMYSIRSAYSTKCLYFIGVKSFLFSISLTIIYCRPYRSVLPIDFSGTRHLAKCRTLLKPVITWQCLLLSFFNDALVINFKFWKTQYLLYFHR